MKFFHPDTLRKIFNHAAHTYDASAVLYREVAHRLLENLDFVRMTPQRILDLGAGTGYITQLLKKRYPYAQIISVDFSTAMLQQSKCTEALSICADTAQIPLLDASVDLIVSGLMLPWCNDISAVFAQMQRVLKAGGLLLFSTFGPDTLAEMRASWAMVDEMSHVHLFFDLHDVGDALMHTGFSDPVIQTEWLTLMYGDIKNLFLDLKNTGAVNMLLERRMTLTGKERFQKFLAEYETYRDKNKLPATFEIIYGHCWKSEKNMTQANEIIIPIASLKKSS